MISRTKYACWACRKVCKANAVCPDCHQPMVDMGYRWRPPRRTQVRRWAEQQRLYEGGYRPDGSVNRWAQQYEMCRWCGKRCDREHTELMDAARRPGVWGWKYRSTYYGKKRMI